MLKKLGFVLLCIFAVIGFVFTAVFIALQLGLFNVRGSAKARDTFFEQAVAESTQQTSDIAASPSLIGQESTAPDPAIDCVERDTAGKATGTCPWNNGPEWTVVRAGLQKDQAVIRRVSDQTGVSSRLIAAAVVPEQLRYFTSDRENFKNLFEPLKILGALTKFSLGVSGVKLDTAKQIEIYASDANSDFYPGDGFATMLAYQTPDDHDGQLYNRLTDQKDHYYSYLYTALFLREVAAQWDIKGFTPQQEAGVYTTIFNLGFSSSKPKAAPKLGGSTINLGGNNFSFGELGQLFFRSQELRIEFP